MIRDPGSVRELSPDSALPEYSDSLMTDELFAEAMAEATTQPSAVEATSLDQALIAPEVVNDEESLEALAASMLPPDPVQEIEATFDQQMQQLAEALEPPQPEPMPQDPFEMQQQMYDDQMRQLLDPFGMWGPGPMM